MKKLNFTALLVALGLFMVAGPSHATAPVTITVTSLADSGANTLRAAITTANGDTGDTINFTGLSGTITLASALPQITAPMTITGPGAIALAIDGAATYEPFKVAATGVTISGLTIKNGAAPDAASGGGIDVAATGGLTLSDCALTDNTSAIQGGGIMVEDGGSATIADCTLSGNSAANGGGITSGSTSTTTVTNCTIANNTASVSGGGIEAIGAITIFNCTFSGNTATTAGGGLLGGVGVTITNCIFYGDSSPSLNEIDADSSTVSHSDVNQGGFTSSNANIDQNPVYATGGLGYYGGQTQTIALQSTSPCLGAGIATGAPLDDQRGNVRPATPSMGAYDAPTVLPAITITPTTLPATPSQTPYSQVLTATGGTAPYTYVISDGIRPPGLNLSVGGTLSGTPTTPGSYSFTVTATDSGTGPGSPFQNSQVVTLIVNPPVITITPTTLPAAIVNTAYTATLTGVGGLAPYSNYHVVSGALPDPLTISGAGVISGIPATAGKYTFTIQTTDSSADPGPYTGAQAYTLTVSPPIALAPATLPNGNVGVAYTQTVTATGGVSPYAFTVTAGALPHGLALDPSGALTGTPTAAGAFTFTVTATDSSGAPGPYVGSTAYALTIGPATVVVGPATLAPPVQFAPYTANITASGGTAPYTFAVTAGNLPAGFNLATDGTLTGPATAVATSTFTVTATDSSTGTGAPFKGSEGYTLTVSAPVISISPGALLGGTIGAAYNQTMSASGATGPYTFSITTGHLPAGLTISSAGVISGTPTEIGTEIFTITATDSSASPGPFTGSSIYSITVAPGTVVVTPTSLTAATAGQLYSQVVSASGGTAPYSFESSSGLPPGLTLAANGTLSGKATAAGTYTFTVTAVDSSTGDGAPLTGNASVSVTVTGPSLSITPATVPDGTVGVSYVQNLTASGGNQTYTFSGGTGLPAGLSLSAGGSISGVPTASGSFNFTVTVTDSTTGTGAPFSHNQSYALNVASPTIVLTPATLPDGAVGSSYSQTLTLSGGTAPYTFGVSYGTLPAGLALSTAGALTGTPTTAGTFVFTISALDSTTGGGPYIGSRNYSLNVDAHNFAAGLAFISVPADYSDQTVAETLGYASPVLALWDPTTSTYDVSPNAALASLSPGIGYWVRFPAAETIVGAGTPTPTDVPFIITLHAGWNMIGDPFPAAVPLSSITVTLSGGTAGTFASAITAGVIGQNVYGFDGTQYVAATSLLPYQGYWVFTSQDCTLSVPAP